jgi:hypothetical protein
MYQGSNCAQVDLMSARDDRKQTASIVAQENRLGEAVTGHMSSLRGAAA